MSADSALIGTILETITAVAARNGTSKTAEIVRPEIQDVPLTIEDCNQIAGVLRDVPSPHGGTFLWIVYAFAVLRTQRPTPSVAFSVVQQQGLSGLASSQSRSTSTMEPHAAEAAAAVAMLSPYLAEAAKGAANKLGEEVAQAGSKLLGWMRSKLSGRAKDALEDLEKDPTSEDNQADLRKQFAKVLETNPVLITELKALLQPALTSSNVMTQNVSGAGAKATQVVGSGNTTTIT